MICPNPECKRNVSPFDDKCGYCGAPLKDNHPIKNYMKKADQIIKDNEPKAELFELREAVADIPSDVFEKIAPDKGFTRSVASKGSKERNIETPTQTSTKYGSVYIKDKNADYGIDMSVEVDYFNRLNWSLMNVGIPLVQKLKVTNLSPEKLTNIMLSIKLSLDYSDSWKATIPGIDNGQSKQINSIKLPIYKEKLRSIKESEECLLTIEVSSEGKIIYINNFEVQIEPYNQWYYNPLIPHLSDSVAGFVLPNSRAVGEVIRNAGGYLQKLCGISSFHGYQAGGKYTQQMVNAIYLAFQWSLNIDYINPPATFEHPGQKILLHDQILDLKRGTCLNLALFYAACIERIGLYPLIFFIHGHAFLGVWSTDHCYKDFHKRLQDSVDIKEELAMYKDVIKRGHIIPLNSTNFTTGSDFEQCKKNGADYCINSPLYAIVDIEAVRSHVRPMQLET